MMPSPAYPPCKAATAPGPESAGPPANPAPCLPFDVHLQTCYLKKCSTSSGRPRCRVPGRKPLYDIRQHRHFTKVYSRGNRRKKNTLWFGK